MYFTCGLKLNHISVHEAIRLLGYHTDRTSPAGFKVITKLIRLKALRALSKYRPALNDASSIRHATGEEFIFVKVNFNESGGEVHVPVTEIRIAIDEYLLVANIVKYRIFCSVFHLVFKDHRSAFEPFRLLFIRGILRNGILGNWQITIGKRRQGVHRQGVLCKHDGAP